MRKKIMSQIENLIELLTQAEEMKDWDLVIRVIDELRKSIIRDEEMNLGEYDDDDWG
tara:strand:+ start:658 stop:828 length:171 start_codon:yes stop_codon:yes gene_type:complete